MGQYGCCHSNSLSVMLMLILLDCLSVDIFHTHSMLYWGNSGNVIDPRTDEASNVPPQLATIKDNITVLNGLFEYILGLFLLTKDSD